MSNKKITRVARVEVAEDWLQGDYPEEGDEHRDPPDNSDDIEEVAELPIADTGDSW